MRHITLRHTMRATGLLVCGLFGLLTVFMLFGTLLGVGHGPAWPLLTIDLVCFSISGLFIYAGWRMFRRIDPVSVCNFAFIYALVAVYPLSSLLAPFVPSQDPTLLFFLGLIFFVGIYCVLVKVFCRYILPATKEDALCHTE